MVFIQERGVLRDVHVDKDFEVKFHDFHLICHAEDLSLKYFIQGQFDLSKNTISILEMFLHGDRVSSLIKSPEEIYPDTEKDQLPTLYGIEGYPLDFQKEINNCTQILSKCSKDFFNIFRWVKGILGPHQPFSYSGSYFSFDNEKWIELPHNLTGEILGAWSRCKVTSSDLDNILQYYHNSDSDLPPFGSPDFKLVF